MVKPNQHSYSPAPVTDATGSHVQDGTLLTPTGNLDVNGPGQAAPIELHRTERLSLGMAELRQAWLDFRVNRRSEP